MRAKKVVVGYKNAMSLESMVFVTQSVNEEESDPSFQEKCVEAFKELLESGEVEFLCHESEEEWGYITPPGDYD